MYLDFSGSIILYCTEDYYKYKWIEDVKWIFKHQGKEAISSFNWTNLVSNEVAFWILEEIKHQLKERNEPKQSTTATDPNQWQISKEAVKETMIEDSLTEDDMKSIAMEQMETLIEGGGSETTKDSKVKSSYL